MPANWFREWFNTPYYHQLYFEHNEKEAASLVHQLIGHLHPAQSSRMIDVGCGRGRHSKILASLGFDVTGIDISPDSIQYARQFENDHLHFYEHDMRLPFWINYFQYAFNLFTSFGYFRTEREHYNAIRTIAQSLSKGGTFVLDYLNTHYAEDHLIHQSEKHFDGVTYYLTKWFDESHFFKRIVIEDEKRKTPLEFVERVAKYTLGDFNDMFAFHGLQMQEVFGNYDLDPYDVKHSPRLLMIARKKVY
ncbi:MAG: class I SAM-dependent methyltransferase [Bacteroidetes bacterium]|nr:MAG: class I SAM-dependent methyltransferase [Bacteroidota bacterium]